MELLDGRFFEVGFYPAGADAVVRLVDRTAARKQEGQLLEAVIEGQEQERARVSRELHDGAAQMLSGAAMQLELIAEAGEAKTTEGRAKGLESVLVYLKEVLQELQRMAYDLRPLSLEATGLVPALRSLCERADKTKAETTVSFYGPDQEPEAAKGREMALYRIAQEALQNALKHAEATEVEIFLVEEENGLLLRVSDDGSGLDQNSVQKGLGLENMRTRARLVGVSLEVESEAGAGTHVSVGI